MSELADSFFLLLIFDSILSVPMDSIQGCLSQSVANQIHAFFLISTGKFEMRVAGA